MNLRREIVLLDIAILSSLVPPSNGAGIADAQRHGVDQHEGHAGALVAAIGPGMIGAALDHDVARLHLHRRIVHIHLDLALEHDDIVDRLGAVHARLVAGREIDHRETRPVCRRRRAEDARAQVLDLLADRDVGRRPIGRPDHGRDRARTWKFGVGRRAFHDHFGDIVGIVTGHETANRWIVRFIAHALDPFF
jgi:hypothetical protein